MFPTEQLPQDFRQRQENRYGGEEHQKFRIGMRDFIEHYPLYKHILLDPPPNKEHFEIEAATLFCANCRGDRTFRKTESRTFRIPFPGGGGYEETRYLMDGVYPIQLECQDCKYQNYYFMIRVFVDWETGEKSGLMKVGQWPMWLPAIAKDITDELGADAALYRKALRNMNEGYGIGACAYLRRLIEQYINPLLQLLYDIKQEEGADERELTGIKAAIESKDFTRKSAFAAEIAPASVLVKGTNPLKKLHDLLSESLHAHSEDEAMNIALQLSKTVEFVIRRLRTRYEEQKSYAETMKELNKPKK